MSFYRQQVLACAHHRDRLIIMKYAIMLALYVFLFGELNLLHCNEL